MCLNLFNNELWTRNQTSLIVYLQMKSLLYEQMKHLLVSEADPVVTWFWRSTLQTRLFLNFWNIFRAFQPETEEKKSSKTSHSWSSLDQILSRFYLIVVDVGAILPFTAGSFPEDLLSDDDHKNHEQEASDGAQPHNGVMSVICCFTWDRNQQNTPELCVDVNATFVV